jgi:hypothetical protein
VRALVHGGVHPAHPVHGPRLVPIEQAQDQPGGQRCGQFADDVALAALDELVDRRIGHLDGDIARAFGRPGGELPQRHLA